MLKHRQYTYFVIFSSATLNETFTAKCDGVLPITPKVRPKSEIYTLSETTSIPTPSYVESSPRDFDFNSEKEYRAYQSNFGTYENTNVLLCSSTKAKTGSVFPAFCHTSFHRALVMLLGQDRE